MYKWYIKILLKNGQFIYGYIEEDLSNSLEVAKKYVAGNKNNFNQIRYNDTTSLVYQIGDISSMWISTTPFETQ